MLGWAAVPWRAMLCCAVLCWAVLLCCSYAVLQLRCAGLPFAVLHRAALCCAAVLRVSPADLFPLILLDCC